MPVIPPVRTILLNDHKDLVEGELHYPKGYTLAGRESYPVRNVHAELEWQFKYYQEPVIGFTSVASSAPSDGDRYIYTGVGSSAEFGGATTNSIVSYLTVDSYGLNYNSWDFIAPQAGTLIYATSVDTFYYYDGSIWKDLAAGINPTDKDNATVTLNGGANNGLINNYVNLFTPAVGKMFESILLKSTGLLPSNGSTLIKVVLHDGTPANDIEIMPSISTAELNGILFKYGCNGEVVSGGYSLKLLITGNTVTAGTVLVVANYLI
jgi:hypothetical protein